MDVIPESASERMKLVNSHSQFHLHNNNFLFNTNISFPSLLSRGGYIEDEEEEEYDDN